MKKNPWLLGLIPGVIIGLASAIYGAMLDIQVLKTEDVSIQRDLKSLKEGQEKILDYLLDIKSKG